uniref:Uncharacterized protein n=1 Tax=Globisporangium ultimum (strain ATCC 200006 / CBS 805.95 / DAOM BR144) TaxID=431595 RepID=K3X5N6_GLOUD
AAINALIRRKVEKENAKTNHGIGKKRKNRDLDTTVPYSSLSWSDIEPILRMESCTPNSSTIADDDVKSLHTRIAKLREYYGEVHTGKGVKRLMFIAAVIETVCRLLGDVKILVEEDVHGNNVYVHGRFEFVLKRRDKRISIVGAKRDDIEQGMAQNVTDLEALSDVEGLDVAYGIVTNYLEWIFIIDDDVA